MTDRVHAVWVISVVSHPLTVNVELVGEISAVTVAVKSAEVLLISSVRTNDSSTPTGPKRIAVGVMSIVCACNGVVKKKSIHPAKRKKQIQVNLFIPYLLFFLFNCFNSIFLVM